MNKIITQIIGVTFLLLSANSLAAIVTLNGTFSNITSDLTGGVNEPPDCFDQREPITAPITGANPFNNQMRFGNPSGGGAGQGCANSAANFENKSGMGHQGGSAVILDCPAPGTADPVSLGEFTHYNNDLSVLNPKTD